jgi:hypothetical protein
MSRPSGVSLVVYILLFSNKQIEASSIPDCIYLAARKVMHKTPQRRLPNDFSVVDDADLVTVRRPFQVQHEHIVSVVHHFFERLPLTILFNHSILS